MFAEIVECKLQIERSMVLLGQSGCGKSAIGKRISARLGFPFIDTDTLISKKIGCSISEYFAKYGESEFRGLEREVIREILTELEGDETLKHRIISLGGGAWQCEQTRNEVMRSSATSVWLDVDTDILWERISRHPERRPMLQVADPRARLAELESIRRPAFAMACCRVKLGYQTIDAAAAQVIATVSQFVNKNA